MRGWFFFKKGAQTVDFGDTKMFFQTFFLHLIFHFKG